MTSYQIGENGIEIEDSGYVSMYDYDLYARNLVNEDNSITITAKTTNKTTGKVVSISQKYDINPSITNSIKSANSLLDAMESYSETGISKCELTVNGSESDETYNLKIYSFDSDLEILANTEFGSDEDVATSSVDMAKNMIVLRVDGNLTIDENVTLTSYANSNGYGGPKGMFIYCTGTIINNGNISMTARGAYAEGQNVYLYKNLDNTYEYVPATGAIGGDEHSYAVVKSGYNANTVQLRATGGGGTGGFVRAEGNVRVANGGTGTSYSGGTGSGAAGAYDVSSVEGSNYGGTGGNAGYRYRAGFDYTSKKYNIGGTGNPTGTSGWSGHFSGEHKEIKNGTGGLLIVYAQNIDNNGIIESKGVDSNKPEVYEKNDCEWYEMFTVPGGASGGGSVNVFYSNSYNSSVGTYSAKGGNKKDYSSGSGGDGSVSIGKITNGSYEPIAGTYVQYYVNGVQIENLPSSDDHIFLDVETSNDDAILTWDNEKWRYEITNESNELIIFKLKFSKLQTIYKIKELLGINKEYNSINTLLDEHINDILNSKEVLDYLFESDSEMLKTICNYAYKTKENDIISCTATASEARVISVNDINNIKIMSIYKNGKIIDNVQDSKYNLIDGDECEIFVRIIDSNLNVYESNKIQLDLLYNENSLLVYWYGYEYDKENEFGLWTQYSSWWNITRKSTSIIFTGGHTSNGGVVEGFTTKKPIDLSLYRNMHIIFNKTASGGRFNIVSSLGNQGSYGNEGGVITNNGNIVTFDEVNEPTRYDIDISSLTGNYYIGTQIWGAKGDYEVLRMVV